MSPVVCSSGRLEKEAQEEGEGEEGPGGTGEDQTRVYPGVTGDLQTCSRRSH